jgi:voltage-gated potassium channel
MAELNRLRRAILLLILVVGVGVAGYVGIEGWNVFDAFYMTVITLATIGYGEVQTLHPAGRAFTVLLILLGLTVGTYTLGAFTELIVAEKVQNLLGKRRMERGLAQLKNHMIICGWGRMGQEIAREFRSKEVPFVVIELSEEKAHQLAEMGLLVVTGDAANDQSLRAAGAERARGLIAVAPRDADNIFITLSARAMNPDLFIIARSVYEQDQHKLELAGADRVISPYVIGARRIAAAAFHPTVVDFLDLEVHHAEMEWELEDLEVTGDCWFAGKTLRESGIREETGCTVLAVKQGATGRFVSNPPPNTMLDIGDWLIVLGTLDQLREMERRVGIPSDGLFRHANVARPPKKEGFSRMPGESPSRKPGSQP